MKKLKNRKSFLAISAIAIGIAPIVTLASIENNKSVSLSNNGFDLTKPTSLISEAEILNNAFKNVDYHPGIQGIGEGALIDGPNRNVVNSKIQVYSEHFRMYFDSPSIGGVVDSIITASLKSNSAWDVVSTKLPENTKDVLSAQYIENILWLIINTGLADQNAYQLVAYQFLDQDSGVPIINQIPNSLIPLNFDITVESNLLNPAIVPVYSIINQQLVARENQVLVFLQNETIANLGSSENNKLEKITWENDNTFSRQDITMGQLPDSASNQTARAMSIFAFDNNPISSEQSNLTLGVYHSINADNDAEIAYSTFENNQYINSIYNEKVGDIGSMNLQHLMAYPKITLSDQGYELLWVFTRDFQENTATPGSRIFSTSLNTQFHPYDIEQQANIISIGTLSQEPNIRYIDYRENGNFSQGTIYVPIKLEMNDGIIYQGIINWFDTKNDSWWNKEKFLVVEEVDNAELSNKKRTVESTYLDKIEFDQEGNALFNFLFLGVYEENAFIFASQNYRLNDTKDNLVLNYNTFTPDYIITNNTYNSLNYSQSDIIDEIRDYSNDFLSVEGQVGNQIVAVNNTLSFDIKDDLTSATIEITYPNGTYENGIYKAPTENLERHLINLLEQPIDFFPFQVKFNENPSIIQKSSSFAQNLISKLPENGFISEQLFDQLIEEKLIGDINSGAYMEMSDVYLKSLKAISFTSNDTDGVANFNFTFQSGLGQEQQVSLPITGFQSATIIIASTIPSAILLLVLIIVFVILYLQHKSKKAILASLKTGMELDQKIKQERKTISIWKPNNKAKK